MAAKYWRAVLAECPRGGDESEVAKWHITGEWRHFVAVWSPQHMTLHCVEPGHEVSLPPDSPLSGNQAAAEEWTRRAKAEYQASLEPESPPLELEQELVVQAQPAVLAKEPAKRCIDCRDVLPSYRGVPRCRRCHRVYLEGLQAARDRERLLPQVLPEPQRRRVHCRACRTSIPYPGKDMPVLCASCRDRQAAELAEDDKDPVLRRTTGLLPHLAFYTNRQGESVVNGRILPHPRYGESRADYFGDTPEWDRH